MAVVTTKSASITNRDATPVVLSNSAITKADVRKAIGVVSIASGDSITSKYLVLSVPSNAIPVSLKVSSPDIGTTTEVDVGLYKNTGDGGAVVDVDFFDAALSLNGGALSKSELIFNNVVTIANFEKRIWQHLALTEDSKLIYDVVLTLTGAADAAGTLVLELEYTE